MKLDLIYLAATTAIQFFLFPPFRYPFLLNFLAANNFLVWAAFCSLLFAVYPWLRARFYPGSAQRRLTGSTHLTTIFVASTAISYTATELLSTDEFVLWPLFFIALPSSVAAFTSYFISHAVLRSTNVA